MVASNFDDALKRVLVHEGGWSNHPKDPGGATMKGVIQRVYDGYRDRMNLGRRSVRNITDAELKAIYRRQYWDVIRGDDLPSGVDFCVFDGAVNSGPSQAAKWLQRAVGVSADGQVGEATLDAVRSLPPIDVIRKVGKNRLAMLKGLKTWGTFGKGWQRRVNETERDAIAMATAAPLPPVKPEIEAAAEPAAPKATAEDRSLKDIAMTPEGMATGGGLLTTIITAATNPGPLQWAMAAAFLIIVSVGAYYFVQRMRRPA